MEHLRTQKKSLTLVYFKTIHNMMKIPTGSRVYRRIWLLHSQLASTDLSCDVHVTLNKKFSNQCQKCKQWWFVYWKVAACVVMETRSHFGWISDAVRLCVDKSTTSTSRYKRQASPLFSQLPWWHVLPHLNTKKHERGRQHMHGFHWSVRDYPAH